MAILCRAAPRQHWAGIELPSVNRCLDGAYSRSPGSSALNIHPAAPYKFTRWVISPYYWFRVRAIPVLTCVGPTCSKPSALSFPYYSVTGYCCLPMACFRRYSACAPRLRVFLPRWSGLLSPRTSWVCCLEVCLPGAWSPGSVISGHSPRSRR